MEAQEQEARWATLLAALVDRQGNIIESVTKAIEQGHESNLLMMGIYVLAHRPQAATGEIAVQRGEVCATCDGLYGGGHADCPIYRPMPVEFGGTPEDCFCPFWSSGERVAEDAEGHHQDLPETPAEAVSEAVSEPVSEAISEAKSGPEIAAKIPDPYTANQPSMVEQMLGITPEPKPEKQADRWCRRCGTEVHPSHLTGKRLFYNIEVLSERHLCADCVLDLMASDPTADEVMRYVFKEGQTKPFYSQHRPDRYPFNED